MTRDAAPDIGTAPVTGTLIRGSTTRATSTREETPSLWKPLRMWAAGSAAGICAAELLWALRGAATGSGVLPPELRI